MTWGTTETVTEWHVCTLSKQWRTD